LAAEVRTAPYVSRRRSRSGSRLGVVGLVGGVLVLVGASWGRGVR
jgi:hypothetical protein